MSFDPNFSFEFVLSLIIKRFDIEVICLGKKNPFYCYGHFLTTFVTQNNYINK